MAKKEQTLLLLDAHAIVHRAYHALPDFTAPDGRPTGALYGMLLMLLGAIEQFSPDYIVAAYDLPGKTFRHEVYEEYKDGRGETEEPLKMQLQSSRELCEKLSIPIYDAPGFEADDMLGTIVEQLKKDKKTKIIIASGDMDTLQLVSGDQVQVFTLKRGLKDTVVYDEDAVNERFSFGPKQLIDYKGLRGDPSDNIAGVKGIGEKTATQLITAFGSIEQIYKTLKKNPEKFDEQGIKARVQKLLTAAEDDALFSKALATIRRDAPIEFTWPEQSWRESVEVSGLTDYLRDLGFRTIIGRIEGLFVGKDPKTVAEPTYQPTTEEVTKYALAVWVLDSEMSNPGIEDILRYAGESGWEKAVAVIEQELTDKNLRDVYEQIELPLIPIVAAMQDRGILLDRDHFAELGARLGKQVDKLEAEIHTLAGQEFNVRSPKQLGEVLFDQMGISTKGVKKTAGGARSTRESELVKLKDEHPIIAKLLEYRELHKLLSTYVAPIPDMADEEGRLHAQLLQAGTSTGRFSSQHPNMQNIPIRGDLGKEIRNGFIATPGFTLLACDYSQIELRVAAMLAEDEFMIKTFQSGGDIHTAVASQVFKVPEKEVTSEMRRQAKVINFGIIYGMGVNALRENLGTTRAEAQEFYNKYFETFGSIQAYLEGTKEFAHQHGYTETLLGRRRYFPALRSHLPYIRAQAERMAINAPVQGTATADIIKLALKHVWQLIQDQGWQETVYPLVQIHDELLFEIKDEYLEEAIPLIVAAMEQVLQNSYRHYTPSVPLRVSADTAKRWGDIK